MTNICLYTLNLLNSVSPTFYNNFLFIFMHVIWPWMKTPGVLNKVLNGEALSNSYPFIFHFRNRERLCPEVQPLPFYIPFWQKRYPFYIPFIEKRYPFHILTLGSLVVSFM